MADSLTDLTTALSDRYRIERELEAGGMATVYFDRGPQSKVRHDQEGQERNEDRVDILRPRNPDAERKPDARHADRIEQLAAEESGHDQCQGDERQDPHRPAADDARAR